MREILFKAKQKDWSDLPEESWWVEGYYAMMGKCNLIRHYIVQNCALTGLFEDPEENMYFNDVEIDPKTLCQYTGLKDKNGNRIWENDIVKGKRRPGLDERYYSIFFDSEENYLTIKEHKYGEKYYFSMASARIFETVGNIFDNPELVKGE